MAHGPVKDRRKAARRHVRKEPANCVSARYSGDPSGHANPARRQPRNRLPPPAARCQIPAWFGAPSLLVATSQQPRGLYYTGSPLRQISHRQFTPWFIPSYRLFSSRSEPANEHESHMMAGQCIDGLQWIKRKYAHRRRLRSNRSTLCASAAASSKRSVGVSRSIAWIAVRSTPEPGPDDKLPPAGFENPLERINPRHHAAGLEAGDRRLREAGAGRQLPLGQPSTSPRLRNHFSRPYFPCPHNGYVIR